MSSRSEAVLEQKLGAVWPMLDERTRRLMAASEARALGYGGVSLVHRACGLSRQAIARGIREIEGGARLAPGRMRRPGAGRKAITARDPQPAGRAGPADRARHPGRSGVAVALDLQEHADAGGER